MSYRDWKVGDRVVCVDAAIRHESHDAPRLLKIGRVYTVRGITHWNAWKSEASGIGVWLEEVRRKEYWGVEHPWGAFRFRPVQSRKTDISCFEALLHTNKHKEPV